MGRDRRLSVGRRTAKGLGRWRPLLDNHRSGRTGQDDVETVRAVVVVEVPVPRVNDEVPAGRRESLVRPLVRNEERIPFGNVSRIVAGGPIARRLDPALLVVVVPAVEVLTSLREAYQDTTLCPSFETR